MPTDTTINNLVINKNITKAQLEAAIQAGTITDDQISFVTDDDVVAGGIPYTTQILMSDDKNWAMLAYYFGVPNVPSLANGTYRFFVKSRGSGSENLSGFVQYCITFTVSDGYIGVVGMPICVPVPDSNNTSGQTPGWAASPNMGMDCYRLTTGATVFDASPIPGLVCADWNTATNINAGDVLFAVSKLQNIDTGEWLGDCVILTDVPSGDIYGTGLVETAIYTEYRSPFYRESYTPNDQFWNAYIGLAGSTDDLTLLGLDINNHEPAWATIDALVSLYGADGVSKFVAHVVASGGVANADVITAVGDFAGVNVYTALSTVVGGTTFIFRNANTPWTTDVNVVVSCMGRATTASIISTTTTTAIDVSAAAPTPGAVVTTMPAITAAILGRIHQYVGMTDANYTQGYFYKATGTPVTVPSSVTVTEQTQTGTTVTIDIDAFVSYMENQYGVGQSDVSGWLNNSAIDGLYFEYNAPGQSLIWAPIGDITGALSYFTFSPAPDGVVIFVTENLVPGRIDVQNGAWAQIDVQPTSGGLPDQTGNAGKFLTTDGTDASWADAVVNYGWGSGLWLSPGNTDPNGTRGQFSIALGGGRAQATRAVQIGGTYESNGHRTIAQNDDANTVKIAITSGNYEIMSPDGTVPHGRLTNAVVPNAVTIAVADWNGGTACTKTISGLTATSVVWVAPDSASQSDYLDSGVYASAQATDSITFTAITTPTSALTVNVIYC